MKTTYDYRPALFFVMAYAVTWIIWFLGVYVGSQPGYESYAGLFSLIGLVGPIGTTLFLVLTSRCAALKRDFKDRIFKGSAQFLVRAVRIRRGVDQAGPVCPLWSLRTR